MIVANAGSTAGLSSSAVSANVSRLFFVPVLLGCYRSEGAKKAIVFIVNTSGKE
jgi:hypothetical protein